MRLKISFKHLKHTEALDDRIKEKSEKFEKYFQGNTNVQWLCWVNNEEHWAEVKVTGPKFTFFAKASADNMYKSLDLVVEKMERQIDKQKELKRNRIHAHSYQTPKYLEIEERIRDEEEYQYKEYEEKSA